MPLFKTIWNLATDAAVYKGAFVVVADDAEHAIERSKDKVGPEGGAAAWRVEGVDDQCFELGRNTVPADTGASRPLPSMGARTLYAFEVAARANIIADSEEVAFKRFGKAVIHREHDGRHCKLLRTAVLEREAIDEMSAFEKAEIEKGFRRAVQGGGMSPR